MSQFKEGDVVVLIDPRENWSIGFPEAGGLFKIRRVLARRNYVADSVGEDGEIKPRGWYIGPGNLKLYTPPVLKTKADIEALYD